MDYIKVDTTTYIKRSALNKKRNNLPIKRGRPKQTDYVISLPTKKRTELNKLINTKKVSHKKIKHNHNKIKISVFILLSLFVIYKAWANYNYNNYHVSGLVYSVTRPIILDNETPKVETIEDMICNPSYDWDCETMIAIFKSENGYQLRNGWDSKAQYKSNSDGSTDTGIAMINSIHGYSEDDLMDAKFNINIAYKIYKSQGLMAWTDYRNDRYLKYLFN